MRHASALSNTRSLSQAVGSRISSARWPAAPRAATRFSMWSSAPPRVKGTWAPHTAMSIATNLLPYR